jgi:hypothetical protein
MMFVYLETDELTELWNFLRDKGDTILDYAKDSNLSYEECKALFSAINKVEKATEKDKEGKLV